MKFTFDGKAVEARAGETLAAALTRAGVYELGQRRDGTARGVFCGMGVCQECLVTVDGRPSRRACMEVVCDGIVVTSQGYAPVLPPPSGVATQPPIVERPQVLVVGAGPAGLAAALAAARCGAKVTVLDERAKAGGQYFKQRVDGESIDGQMREGRELLAQVAEAGITIVSGATVWGAFPSKGSVSIEVSYDVAMESDPIARVFVPDRLVLATGVYERGVPMPGWTLPGVMTTGAAQTLLRAYGVVPGKRVVVGGNGPLNFQLAAELLDAGVDVAAVVEAGRPTAKWGSVVKAAIAAPGLMGKGLRYLARINRAHVPIHYRSTVVAVNGTSHVDSCTVTQVGDPQVLLDFKVDAVCLNYGFLPSNELARALGCRPGVDADGLTSVEHVYAVGDAVAFRGAHVARCQGRLTGCAVARSLGLAVPDVSRVERELARHLSFQRALWDCFAAPDIRLARQGTIVCRCENVARGAVDDAIAHGATTPGAVKRRTRAGMGRCQGRYCESIVAGMLPQGDERSALAPRPPAKPVRIEDLA